MKFKNYIETESGIKDTSASPGTAGQLLSSTVAGTSWIDQNTISSGTSESVDLLVKNISAANGGVNLSKGDPVYIYGDVGASPRLLIDLADADSTATNNLGDDKMPVVGLLDQDLSPNGEGTATVVGKLRNLITSPIDGVTPWENATLYVKVGGGLTLYKPTGPDNLIQNVGQVGRISTSNDGNIVVAALLRSNDIPNLPEGRIWVGDSNTVVSDTVYLDETNERMGIGTITPDAKLEVVGTTGVIIDSGSSSAAKLTLIGDGNAYGGGGIIDIIGGSSDFMSYSLNLKRSPSTLEASNEYWMGNSRWTWDGNIGVTRAQPYTSYDFKTQGSSQMVIYNNNLGIGVTAPSQKLHVNGSARVTGAYYDSSNSPGAANSVLISTISGTVWGARGPLGSGTTNYLARWTPDANTLGIGVTYDNGTNVGIGTNIPNSKLQVDGEIDANGNDGYRINGKPWAAESSNNLRLGDWDGEGFSTSIYDDNSAEIVIVKDYGAMISCSSLTSSYGADASLAVGLGTGGAAVLTLSNTDANPSSAGDATGIIQFAIKDDQSGLGYTSALIRGSISQAAGQGNGGGGILDFYTAPYGTGNSPQLRMRINDIGNVGIGSTTPSEKLVVRNGTSNTDVKILAYNPSAGTEATLKFSTINSETNYEKAAIIARNANGSWGRNDMHFALDSAEDNGNVDFSDTKMTILNGGNVGIGITDPSHTLEVKGTVLVGDGNTSYLYLHNTGNFLYGDTYGNTIIKAADNFRIQTTGGLERVRVNSSGNVGIFTSDPKTKLHVASASGSDTPTAGTATGGLFVSNTNKTYGVNMGVAGAGWSFIQSQRADGNTTLYNLNLQPLGGNVGIGTTSPDVKFEVESTTSASGIRIKNTNSGFASLDIESNRGTGSNLGGLRYKKTGQANSQAEINYVAGTRFDFLLGNGTAALTNKLSILENGNVGINDNTPSYKLDVNGTGRFTSTVVATNFILSSDETLKDNIKEIDTKHVDVDWKNFELKSEPGIKRAGVIAQELEIKHPEFVRTAEDGLKSVAYIDLLITKIAELEARLEKLEK